MIQYFCDRCRCQIHNDELRYVVKIDAEATITGDDVEDKIDFENLKQAEHLLDDVDPHELDELERQIHQQKRYDLCSDCFQQYARDPLASDQLAAIEFSKN